ncbi:hypothetical protein CWE09_06095 [Aliidiomarina minuta]|uniref:HTH cro/C1-type domain-containing protein n=1 Tax=Aliidiomarina minuta TaxID=880057 RepID=A0A432W866_9GAMM|nr:helix-turn-helix transcriptional regulator [Aliidiomarina minuta]RUO26284.1 hypothetical protein CWE09_06095 [Aliidiomarina minuta]
MTTKDNEFDIRLAELLCEARQARGLSLRKLASAVGVSPTTIMRIEAAERKPSLFLVMQLCHALEISAAELVAKLEGNIDVQRHVFKESKK